MSHPPYRNMAVIIEAGRWFSVIRVRQSVVYTKKWVRSHRVKEYQACFRVSMQARISLGASERLAGPVRM